MWKIVIPNWHPLRLNQIIGRPWYESVKAKRLQHGMIAMYTKKAGVPRAHKKRRVTLSIYLGPRQRGGDTDAYWKVLLDSLKRCHAIVDDKTKWVELAPLELVALRKRKMGTVIVLEDLDPPGPVKNAPGTPRKRSTEGR